MAGGIQGRIQAELDEIFERSRARLEEARSLNRLEARRLVKLGVGYFWDPVKKRIFKKSGTGFQFVRHDRRKRPRGHGSGVRRLVPINAGLLWDEAEKKLYLKQGDNLIFYAPDRRKAGGASPTGAERRSA